MKQARESLCWRGIRGTGLWIGRRYQSGCVAAFFRWLGGWINAIWRGSAIRRAIVHNGAVARSWESSIFCRILTEIVNFVSSIAYVLYPVLRGSVVWKFFCALDRQLYVLISWVILALLVVPNDNWNNTYSFAAVLIFWFIASVAVRKDQRFRFKLSELTPWTVAFAFFVCLSCVFSVSRSDSVRYLCFHMTCMLLVILCVTVIEKTRQLVRLDIFAMFGLIAASGCAWYQKITGVEVDEMMVDLTVNQDTPGRVFSFFENPNAFGIVIVMLLPIALALLIRSKSFWVRLLAVVAILSSFPALMMTYSRGAWVGLAVALVLFFIIQWPKLTPLLILLCLLALPAMPDTILHRVFSMLNSTDSSVNSRIPVYKAMLGLIREHPITGVGLGSDAVRSAIASSGHYHSTTLFVHGHDIYLQIWAETGIFGLITFLGAMFTAIRDGMRVIVCRKAQPMLRSLTAAGVSGLAGTLVFSIADYPWSYPRVMTIFWLMFAMLLTAIRLAKREADGEEV
ncbi:MAG: O-antigen ligase family protein [Oscillospiraceae bacterium]|nr:O-antigen ligase family protein [Oscillospiraceae bacterium]